MFSTRLVRSVALAALLAPSIGFAQSAAPTPPTAAPASSSPAPTAATQSAVDQRIRTLQSQLGITEAQMPLWSAFAQAMRDNAAATDALFTQRAGAVATMNALDNMHSYAQIARALFEKHGTGVPPDATFTLRLNVGSAQGWKEVR